MKFNVFCIGAVCSLLFVSCSAEKQDEKKTKLVFSPEQLKGIEYSESVVRPIMGEITLNGKVVPDENNLVNVYPMIGGKVTDVDFEIGDLVDLEKPLIVLNSGENSYPIPEFCIPVVLDDNAFSPNDVLLPILA
jgi:cobalt-zinc-cadmium efflux system membrane fusion protein